MKMQLLALKTTAWNLFLFSHISILSFKLFKVIEPINVNRLTKMLFNFMSNHNIFIYAK